MNIENLENRIDVLRRSVETLILIEIAKSGATRVQARKVLGSLDNNLFSRVSGLFHKGINKK